MIQYLPIVLVCSIAMPVNECHKDNKDVTDVIVGEAQNSVMSCIMNGNVKMASSPLGTDNKYYVKIKCVPKEVNG